MRTPNVTEVPGLALSASDSERQRVFRRPSAAERVALMRAGSGIASLAGERLLGAIIGGGA
jgi:hypothetical protein